MKNFWSENEEKCRQIGTWVVSGLWIWALLSYWSCLPIPKFPISNLEVSFFLILGIQILLCCDLKEMLLFRNREWNYVVAILVVTVICLFLAASRPGAFFTVCNFCLLLYLCNRWDWKVGSQCLVICGCLGVYAQWLFWPLLTEADRNPNMAGTVIVFLTFTMFVFAERWVVKRKWRRVLLQVILLLVAVGQLWIYHGRGTAVALLFFCIMRYLIPAVWWQKEKLYRLAFGILTIGSVMFAILYTAAWQLFDPEKSAAYFWKKTIFWQGSDLAGIFTAFHKTTIVGLWNEFYDSEFLGI